MSRGGFMRTYRWPLRIGGPIDAYKVDGPDTAVGRRKPMKTTLALVVVAMLAQPSLGMVTIDASFSIRPGSADTTGDTTAGLAGTLKLDENRHLTFSLDQDGSTLGQAEVDLSRYLIGRGGKIGKAYVYSKIFAPVIQTVLADVGASDELSTIRDAVKAALNDSLDGIDGTELSRVLDAANAVADLADIAWRDVVDGWPGIDNSPATVARIIGQLEKNGILPAGWASDLASELDQPAALLSAPAAHSNAATVSALSFAAPVPEPASLALMAVGGLLLLRRRAA